MDTVVKALLLENIHPLATELLSGRGIDVATAAGSLDEDELIDALEGVSLLGIRSKTTVSERVLASRPDLQAIGVLAIGTNQVGLEAAVHRGGATVTGPFSNTRPEVELALAEIIAPTRRLTEKDKAMRSGVWDKSATGAHEVRGRTLGIVGYGNIGTQLSVLAEALGMRVVFYDTAEKLALGNARRMASLEELLDVADIVTLHVDGRPGNAGMFGRAQFDRMRPGSIFLNLSRGFLVDYAALRERIEAGEIVGAAVDVFPDEPNRNGEPFDSELRGLPNVILTPHIGGSTQEAQEGIGHFVSNKLVRYLTDGTSTMSVNVPQLDLDPAPGARYRVSYLHRNTPGALALVNQAFAESGANIEGQILGTAGGLGYVLTDIGGELPDEARIALANVPDTIRLRVLAREGA